MKTLTRIFLSMALVFAVADGYAQAADQSAAVPAKGASKDASGAAPALKLPDAANVPAMPAPAAPTPAAPESVAMPALPGSPAAPASSASSGLPALPGEAAASAAPSPATPAAPPFPGAPDSGAVAQAPLAPLPSPTGPLTQAAEPPPAPLPAGTLPPAPNAATPATADATGAKPETDIKAPDLSQITTPGGPTSEAPALPPLPDTDSANANGNTDEGATGDSSNGNNYFRSERLPDTIYKKKYDRLNKHLPTALYENQVDGLVFLTAKHDDLNGLRAVLDTGRSMELVDAEGDTPLLVAVKHNAINTSRLLLARHANFNITDRNGMTPIQIAEQQGNYQLVRAIEAAGASASQ